MAISCGCKSNSNSSMHAIFFLIILLFSTRACCDDHPDASKRSNCLESERIALLAIKSDLYNSDHWLSSWSGYDCCNWRGIACDNTTSHVIMLDVHYPLNQYASYPDDPYASYPGKSKVNPSLFELKHLKYLDLSFNNFSTHVPSMISSLVHLEYLNLSNAMFDGLIPQQLGNLSNLRFLDLSRCNYYYYSLWSNDLSWLSHLTFLEYLDMNCVNLSTTTNWHHQINFHSLEHLALSHCWLPDAIEVGTNISMNVTRKLKYLKLAGNSLTKVPLNIGSLFHLEYLDLSQNYITDVMLLSMANLTCLEHLDLHSNHITGKIFMSMGNFIHLKYLDLSYNDISGVIPLSMGNFSSLLHLDVSHNGFFGGIPDAFGNFSGLLFLDLSSNELYGCIPYVLGNLINLEELYISANNISCQIPGTIGRLHNLRYFHASWNTLMGQIPLSLGDLCNLEVLDLRKNNIGGELANLFDGLSKCPQGSKLQFLYIYDNKLTGHIPMSLGNLCNLVDLDLSENNIGGELANLFDGLSKCPQGSKLQSLYIYQNKFNGSLPSSLGQLAQLIYLDISSNKLTGSIPSTIANFSSMTVKKNYGDPSFGYRIYYHSYPRRGVDEFRDNIPITAKGSTNEYTKALSAMASIDLSNNELSGEIPKGITKLHGLYFLNLSNNHLIGRIPENIGTMSELESLDLSMNRLMGEIPSTLSSLYFLSFLNLSYNNLSGRIPTGGQLSTFNDSMYAGNKGLCGVPLPKCLGDDANHQSPSQIGENEEGDMLQRVLDCAFIVMGFIVGFWAYFGMLMMKQSIKVAVFQLVDKMYDWVYVQLSLKIAKAKLKLKWQK